MRETLVNTIITYTLQRNGKFYVIGNVPAQACKETGEEFFSPESMERIHEIMQAPKTPVRKMETPVFDYA